jgi:hypothetical protein
VTALTTGLVIGNSTVTNGDALTYVFEIDTVPTFDSGAKMSSGPLAQGAGTSTTWPVSGLLDHTTYYWHAKAQDGPSESAWVVASFNVVTVNLPPTTPTVNNPGNAAWVSTLLPVLQVNPATDPQNYVLTYEFQVASDAAFASVLESGISTTTSWTVPTALTDKSTYYWRARAIDSAGLQSPWSIPAILYVSTGTYQNPSIQVTEPAVTLVPTVQAGRKLVHLAWAGTDLNIGPTVALYYSSSNSAFSGTLIVDGVSQASGTQTGAYDWDVTGLAAGAYYVYAVIYDPRGSGQAFAPGVVVIPASPQSGSVVTTAGANLQTTQYGGQASFTVHLGTAPTATVTLPVSSTTSSAGLPAPQSLVFTPQNWSVDQTVTVTGQADCLPGGNKTYQVLVGNAVSLDPQYIGLAGSPVNLTNQDTLVNWVVTTNNPNVRICNLAIVSTRAVNPTTWEYVLSARFGNSGAAVAGGTATLVGAPPIFQLISPAMTFGALQQGESGQSLANITIRSRGGPLSAAYFQSGAGFRWNLVAR